MRWLKNLLASAAAVSLAAAAGCGGSEPSAVEAPLSFRSGPASPTATIYAVGDGADGGAGAAAVIGLINQAEMDRFLYLGDVYENGTAAEYGRNYDPFYGGFKDVTSPTPGNHEWPARSSGYDPYWDPPGERSTPAYYSVEMAGWELISLNSETALGPSSAQVRWLRDQLSEPGTCRLAFWHRPRYSASQHGDATDLEPLWDALVGHAALVLNGHEHNYQRLKPVRGITQLIAGGGGHERYPVDAADRRVARFWDAGFSILRLELSSGRADFELLRVGKPPLERGTVTCSQPQP